jgi:cytochrome c-type biogenesis protein CcmE
MHPSRKRRIRLVVALSAAVILGVALVYTSLSASNETVQPSQLARAAGGASYQLTGKVADGSLRERSGGVHFRVRDRAGATSVPVSYRGAVPDTFREGREVIITVRKQGTTYVGERDSLITKCPSKFTEDQTTKS